MWTPTNIGLLLTAVSTFFGAVMGSVCTVGVTAYLKLRKARADEIMDGNKYQDSKEAVAFQQATAAYEKLIAAFEARVKTLEDALVKVDAKLEAAHKDYVKVIAENAELRGANKVYMERLMVHDEANKAHLESLENSLKQVNAKVAVDEEKA